MKIYKSVDELIGKTPLFQANNFKNKNEITSNLFVKLEYLNPTGSVKDRIARSMILDAEKQGLLTKGGTIIEPTSGNTGIGIASIGTSRGYKVIIVMPETMSIERRKLMASYGAELVLTSGKEGMKGAINKANELLKEIPGSIVLGQFINPSNPKAHYETTGPEIFNDLDGNVDVLIAGVGTGGTISGAGKYLKERNPSLKVIAVEPQDSPVLSKGVSGPHKIQGIGAGFIPDTLDTTIYDEIIAVSNEDAFAKAKEFSRTEGISIGISSGAALFASTLVGKRKEFANKNIVVILPDSGDRYLSTPLFE